MAQLDMWPTGDQEVAGLIPTGSVVEIVKYFLQSFSSTDSRREVSIWQKNVQKYQLTALIED